MIRHGRAHARVLTSIYFMERGDMVDWHAHGKEHTLEALQGSISFQVDSEIFDVIGEGHTVILPANRKHRFWAMENGTIALTMMELEPGSEVIGEPGGVLLAQAGTQ